MDRSLAEIARAIGLIGLTRLNDHGADDRMRSPAPQRRRRSARSWRSAFTAASFERPRSTWRNQGCGLTPSPISRPERRP